MATAADGFPKAAFDSIEFPYSDLSVKGAIRLALHEFPHSPGAEVEKMGRQPYRVTFTTAFHRIEGSQLDRLYPELYPTRLRQLREKFEKELTAELVVPTIGKIKAVATDWTQTFTAQQASGEAVVLNFVEDQDTGAFQDETLDYGLTQMVAANEKLLAAAALADFHSQAALSVFQRINDAVTSVLAIAGRADAMSRLVEAKIREVVDLCSYADGQLQELQNPSQHLVLDALKDLWFSGQALAANVVETREQLLTYRVPKLMSVNQVAAKVHNGSTERTVEILQLNSFEDALAIPAGTLVIYPS